MALIKKRVFELMILSSMIQQMSINDNNLGISNSYAFGGRSFFGSYAIYYPKKTKFKGWMREHNRSTFNKNK